MEGSIPFFRGGFRPFFFGGALWAAAALVLWLLALAEAIDLRSHFDPLAWHRHEMLFGFVGAVIAGFLLTAIPNWTGRLPIAGAPLATLFSLWVAARAAVLFSAAVGPLVAAVLDIGFFCVLAAVAAREVLAANNRNLPVVGLVILFGFADALDYLGAVGLVDGALATKLAVSIVTILISLIGGRIVPSFTRNWLAKQGEKKGLPSQPTRFDVAVIGATALAFLAWVSAPAGWLTGGLFAIAAIMQFVRLSRWSGWKAARDPLVLVLHVGYAWIPIGLSFLAAVHLDAPFAESAAIHALTAGAMATMILAVMTRSILGHTGRELKASAATTLSYVLVTAGAVLRVAAPLGLIDYRLGMEAAGLAWIAAFVVFLFAYTPILLRRRVDERS